MRSRTVIVSALLHLLVFAIALQVSRSKAARRATSVAVVGEKKKPEKKEEPKKAKPKPLVASAKPEPAPMKAAPVKAAPVREAPVEAAPVDTGLTMGNDDGPGIPIGPALPTQNKTENGSPNGNGAKKTAAPQVKKEKVLAPKADSPEEDNCTEAPSKPSPVQRPNEIEYTQEARQNGVEGRLVLKITVGADGAVVSVEVVSSVDAALDAAAIAAVKTWVFKPAMRCGKPMGGATFTLARRFELGD